MTKKEFIELLITKGEFSSKAEAERKLGNVLEAIEDVLGEPLPLKITL